MGKSLSARLSGVSVQLRLIDPQCDRGIIELGGLHADPPDLAGSFQQPAHGDHGDLLTDADSFLDAVTVVGMQPGALLRPLVEVQQQSRGLLVVAVDELALSYRRADEVDNPVLEPLVVRPKLMEFVALGVGDALNLVEVDRRERQLHGVEPQQPIQLERRRAGTGTDFRDELQRSAVHQQRLAQGIRDSLPRSRPTFAAWSNLSMLAVAIVFAVAGAVLAAVFDRVGEVPVLFVVTGFGLTLGFAVPMTVGAAFAPSLRPIRDLAEGTERVAAGDYSQRLPVDQDDDLGALAASFNCMQAGLAERQRLQAAFGTSVDPVLAARLLEQGDDVFTGERREVTVMFVDIRDFTPFAEANTAEDTVTRLYALFEIVVPAVVDAGGHVNKFLGDGALAVFGAPNDLADHADAAVAAGVLIHRLVAERFGGALRIGIGINTGLVIAGTIGGGSKLEFTLIGDTVNVAARVEQLTKTTGDAILLTGHTVDALNGRSPELTDRGALALKGKSAPVQDFGLDPGTTSSC